MSNHFHSAVYLTSTLQQRKPTPPVLVKRHIRVRASPRSSASVVMAVRAAIVVLASISIGWPPPFWCETPNFCGREPIFAAGTPILRQGTQFCATSSNFCGRKPTQKNKEDRVAFRQPTSRNWAETKTRLQLLGKKDLGVVSESPQTWFSFVPL